MKVWGDQEEILELLEMIRWAGAYEKDGLGRCYYIDDVDEGDGWTLFEGDCAWSFYSAFVDPASRSIAEETERLGLTVEAYSCEPGIGFQEHWVIDEGNIIDDECRDFSAYFLGDYPEEELEELAERLGVTVDHMLGNVNDNGDFEVGGFASWDFSFSRPSA